MNIKFWSKEQSVQRSGPYGPAHQLPMPDKPMATMNKGPVITTVLKHWHVAPVGGNSRYLCIVLKCAVNHDSKWDGEISSPVFLNAPWWDKHALESEPEDPVPEDGWSIEQLGSDAERWCNEICSSLNVLAKPPFREWIGAPICLHVPE